MTEQHSIHYLVRYEDFMRVRDLERKFNSQLAARHFAGRMSMSGRLLGMYRLDVTTKTTAVKP